jgi:hypothetical protein
VLGSPWWQVATAVFLALAHTQFAFIGHDANPTTRTTPRTSRSRAPAFTAGPAATKRGAVRWLTTHQAALFFPLPLPQGPCPHMAGVEAVLRPTVGAGTGPRAGLLPTGAEPPVCHRRATAPDERTTTITETTTIASTTRNSRAVDAVRFSHPTEDAPAFRWAAASLGSGRAPRHAPVLFLAPAGDDRAA